MVDGAGPNLLGSSQPLRSTVVTSTDLWFHMRCYIDKHSVVFDGQLGTLKGHKVKLDIDSEVTPKFVRARAVPFSMKEGVEKALEELEKSGIISPVRYSKWATPIVPVVKADGSIRIWDFKGTINQVIKVDPCPLPRVEELFAKLAGGKQFTKLDMSQAYLQLELDEGYVTISTHKGLFRYNRLPFGVSTAPEDVWRACYKGARV